MKSVLKTCVVSSALAFSALSLNAQAYIIELDGVVTEAVGLIATNTSVGDSFTGSIDVNDAAIGNGVITAADINGFVFTAGGGCWSTDITTCPAGTTAQSNSPVNAANVSVDGIGAPTGGTIESGIPLGQGALPMTIDFDNGTFFIDGSVAASTLGADFQVTSPVPIPAAVWLFGSALLGLVGVRRKAA